jgi:hypothetical protein
MRRPFNPSQLSTFNAVMNASCGMSTFPNCHILMRSSPEVPTEHMRCDDGVVPLICRSVNFGKFAKYYAGGHGRLA